MPIGFLSAAQRQQLTQFPTALSTQDLVRFFTLSPTDIGVIPQTSAVHNRLGFAVQLGTVRLLNFCPDDLGQIPVSVVGFVAQQLDISADVNLETYGQRAQTRSDHLTQILDHLGYQLPNPAYLEGLKGWVVQRALEHDRPMVLLQMTFEKLQQEKVVRPRISTLERLVGAAREHARQAIYTGLHPLLTPERKHALDQLLVVDTDRKVTRLTWLRQSATSAAPESIQEVLDKIVFLRQAGVSAWDLTAINHNRLKALAQLGKRSTNQALQRSAEERRYPILLAFLAQTLEETIDEVADLFDRCLSGAYSRSRRSHDDYRKTVAKETNEKVRLLRQLGQILLDDTIADLAVRQTIYQHIPETRLRTAIDRCDALIRPEEDHALDFFATRFSYIRKVSPQLLDTLVFQSNRTPHTLLQAIDLLREMNRAKSRKIPADAPLDFVGTRWRAYVVEEDGHLNRRYYELCVLWELRQAIRSGDIWLEGGRRYTDPEHYYIPRSAWPEMRPEACRLLHISDAPDQRLRQRQTELETHFEDLNNSLPQNPKVRIEDDKLVVSPTEAEEEPESVQRLRALIARRMPRLDLPDVLMEVNQWVPFLTCFEHAGGQQTKRDDVSNYLFGSVLAQATNLGLTGIAQMADLSYRRLLWCTNWYLREETLNAASAQIVNWQHPLPLTQFWGDGTFSSSDGQRFPVAVKTSKAVALPRYFGYGRGLTFYSWTSDQFAQYGSKVIPTTLREATFVLDAILDNETELSIERHTTDTAGYTEIIFALFDLLGLRFEPRIRDLGDQRLYRMASSPSYPHLDGILKGKINTALIEAYWDDMLRLAGSLKMGWVTASLLVGKLQAYPRQSPLAKALQEYGRLIKTLSILRYTNSETHRREVGIQLNKGEAVNDLRQFLFFAKQSKINRRDDEDQANQASCLTLVTNAVITWNTVYMAAILEQLKSEGYEIQEDDLRHISPARYEHINRYGKYSFKAEFPLNGQLRPLVVQEDSNGVTPSVLRFVFAFLSLVGRVSTPLSP